MLTIISFACIDTVIEFVRPEYIFLENAGTTRQVAVRLAGEIARDITVQITGGLPDCNTIDYKFK